VVLTTLFLHHAWSSPSPAAFSHYRQLHRLECASAFQFPREGPLWPPGSPTRNSLLLRDRSWNYAFTTHFLLSRWPVYTLAACVVDPSRIQDLRSGGHIQQPVGNRSDQRPGNMGGLQERLYWYEG
jgi:hypothetical protein